MAPGLIGFPRTIDEKAARVVAGVVAVTALVALLVPAHWLVIPLAYGFWARVLTGPRLSPLGALASRVIAPRLGAPKTVSGPPKRFAQAMGAAMTTAAVVALVLGAPGVVEVLLVLLVIASGLESVLAFCVGCQIFGLLMRAGVIPDEICSECGDIWARRSAA
ncbi:MAG TPA: DUF4395 domain-containing protein [Solirubrobacteraceae bacterium]|nr:DUF4395 domain-containing protein [Solirubrobacteraceae bacterium]